MEIFRREDEIGLREKDGNMVRAFDLLADLPDDLVAILRRVEMVTSEATASFIAPTVDRDVSTCTYGPIPEIKPPM